MLDGHTEGVGIEVMVGFLLAENPIHRYVAQTWLRDSTPKIEKVIEPLIKDLFTEVQKMDPCEPYSPLPAVRLLGRLQTVLLGSD